MGNPLDGQQSRHPTISSPYSETTNLETPDQVKADHQNTAIWEFGEKLPTKTSDIQCSRTSKLQSSGFLAH